MRNSTVLLVLVTMLATLALGCMPSTLRSIAFEPRAYPYVPEMGPDGPAAAK